MYKICGIMQDIAVDLTVFPSRHIDLKSINDASVHEGMLLAAKKVRQKLLGTVHLLVCVVILNMQQSDL